MDADLVRLMEWGGGILLLLIVLAAHKKVLRLVGVVIVPEDSVGIVTKRFVLLGSTRTLPDGRVIALRGEAGIQADTLAPGLHWWLWQYATTLQRFVVLPEGSIGIVEARDGAPIAVGRVLGKRVSCDSFQNARAFLSNGGERGPQLAVIPPGSYRINTALFVIKPCPAIEIPSDRIGLVETMEGTPLSTASGDIAGPVIEGHTSFQDAQAFVDHHGRKGLQEEVLLPGRYFINPKFANVDVVDMTVVPIAHVGVVISYVGSLGEDVTGAEFRHGNMVVKGQRGVWVDPLDPGKYPINPRTTKLEMVPTANVVLNWATGKTEAHKLDERLSSITVRSQDGFTFNLDVSQIIHIPRNAAPKVIARFGSMANLVTQVLEPTIGNYFRNAAQKSDVIDFLKERVNRQSEARQAITTALTEYDVGAVDTLIGDIVPPEALMKTLTDRKLAEQERVTYGTQKQAQEVRKELAQAQAQADTQPQVVNAERQVEIASFEAQTRIKRAEGDAQSKRINAQADANVLLLVGEAEGKKITAVGNAEAEVLKLKGEAINPGNYATIEVAKALASSGMKLVPDVVAGGGGNGGGGSLVDVLLAQLITGKLVVQPPETRK